MENKPQLPRNIRRSIENINKNMTPEMRKQLAEEAKKADEARMKEREFHMETELYISAVSQIYTSLINGFMSWDTNDGIITFPTDTLGGANMFMKEAKALANEFVIWAADYRQEREQELLEEKEIQ